MFMTQGRGRLPGGELRPGVLMVLHGVWVPKRLFSPEQRSADIRSPRVAFSMHLHRRDIWGQGHSLKQPSPKQRWP